MSHFYRLKSVNDFSENPRLYDTGFFNPYGNRGIYFEFKKGFEEIELNPPWPHCRMYKAPLIPVEHIENFPIFHIGKGGQLPDVWVNDREALVSDRAKNIIEQFDDFGHQFYPIDVWDEKRIKINKIPYYRLNVRRFLKVDEWKGEPQCWSDYPYWPDYLEKKYLPTIKNCEELKSKVAEQPMWRHYQFEDAIYLSAAMLKIFIENNITSMIAYSDQYGKAGESFAKFE